MTEFDFLSVLVSIIFGLALTHLLSGQFRFVFQRRMTEIAPALYGLGLHGAGAQLVDAVHVA